MSQKSSVTKSAYSVPGALTSDNRVDVVYHSAKESWAIEVKSSDSNHSDHERGVYQCVKYRAVMEAQDGRSNPKVKAVLITENELELDLAALARLFKIRHIRIPRNRKF
jgi:hypothetical protein